MKRVLVDTGPLVALCDSADRLHGRAMMELDRLKGTLGLCLPVLTEACCLLSSAHLRRRLIALIEREVLRLEAPKNGELVTRRALEWLHRYADHDPDFADGFLIAWAESEGVPGIWTFDREFATVWRTLGGKKLKLVGRVEP